MSKAKAQRHAGSTVADFAALECKAACKAVGATAMNVIDIRRSAPAPLAQSYSIFSPQLRRRGPDAVVTFDAIVRHEVGRALLARTVQSSQSGNVVRFPDGRPFATPTKPVLVQDPESGPDAWWFEARVPQELAIELAATLQSQGASERVYLA